MASKPTDQKPKKKPGHALVPFKKGFDPRRNLAGGPKMAISNDVRGVLKQQFVMLMGKYSTYTPTELRSLLKDPLATASELVMLGLWADAIEGKGSAREELFKLTGFAVQKVEVEGSLTLEHLVAGVKPVGNDFGE